MKVLSKKNTMKQNVLILLGWLATIAVLMVLVATLETTEKILDDTQDLYRIAQTQMAEGDFDGAIEGFEHILEETPGDCVALYLLGELHLVKGLQGCESDTMIASFQKSEEYVSQLLEVYSPDVNAKFIKSLSLMYRSVLVEEDEQQSCMYESYQTIQNALEGRAHRDKSFFALGEWWLVLSENSETCRKSVLDKISLPKSETYLNDFSCYWEEADLAYQKSAGIRKRSILGNYGLMRMGILQKNDEKVVDAYNEVSTHFQFYPTQQHYAAAIKELWYGFLRDYRKQDFEIKPYLGDDPIMEGEERVYASEL